ncbi:hypothetical protein AAWM_11224 [Aspergillus awamori]|uniref:Uncharacterized protein n=1 Tax=Aspergillus awamori TaxID=105351 RepID=A0A401L9Z2_ASPAW|nr:hypothetical protein AAWM_11224 [Aspergillus awamori]
MHRHLGPLTGVTGGWAEEWKGTQEWVLAPRAAECGLRKRAQRASRRSPGHFWTIERLRAGPWAREGRWYYVEGRSPLRDWWRTGPFGASLQERGCPPTPARWYSSRAAGVFSGLRCSAPRLRVDWRSGVSHADAPVTLRYRAVGICSLPSQRHAGLIMPGVPVVAGVSEVRGPFSVPGTDGVCGSLAAGQPSFTDSRGEPPRGSRRSSACPRGSGPSTRGPYAAACQRLQGRFLAGSTCVRTGSWGATVGAIGWSSVYSRCAGGVAVAGHFVCPFQSEAYVTRCLFGGFGVRFAVRISGCAPGHTLQELEFSESSSLERTLRPLVFRGHACPSVIAALKPGLCVGSPSPSPGGRARKAAAAPRPILEPREIVEREALATRLARGVQPAFVPVYFPVGGPASVWAAGQRPLECSALRAPYSQGAMRPAWTEERASARTLA